MKSRTWRNFQPFKKGAKVWLEGRNLKRSLPNPKFAAKQEGPFTITEVLSPSPTNSDSHSHGKFTTRSMLLSYLLITKMKSTAGTSHLHPQISSITKNIMKSKRSFVTKEPRPDGNTLSDGKATPLKKILGFPKQNSPLPRNSSKTIKTPFAIHVL